MAAIIKKKDIGKTAQVVLQKQKSKYESPWEYLVFGVRRFGRRFYESEAYYYRGTDGLYEAMKHYNSIKRMGDFTISFPALRKGGYQ